MIFNAWNFNRCLIIVLYWTYFWNTKRGKSFTLCRNTNNLNNHHWTTRAIIIGQRLYTESLSPIYPFCSPHQLLLCNNQRFELTNEISVYSARPLRTSFSQFYNCFNFYWLQIYLFPLTLRTDVIRSICKTDVFERIFLNNFCAVKHLSLLIWYSSILEQNRCFRKMYSVSNVVCAVLLLL